MSFNFPSFSGPTLDRTSHRARLAERAILGGATAKRPIGRPVSIRHPIRRIDDTPIACVQTRGLTERRVSQQTCRSPMDRFTRLVMLWLLRGVAAALAFVVMTASPGWIGAAFAARDVPWGF